MMLPLLTPSSIPIRFCHATVDTPSRFAGAGIRCRSKRTRSPAGGPGGRGSWREISSKVRTWGDVSQLQYEAAWVLGEIASSTPNNSLLITNLGAVPTFVKLLGSASDEVREEVAVPTPTCGIINLFRSMVEADNPLDVVQDKLLMRSVFRSPPRADSCIRFGEALYSCIHFGEALSQVLSTVSLRADGNMSSLTEKEKTDDRSMELLRTKEENRKLARMLKEQQQELSKTNEVSKSAQEEMARFHTDYEKLKESTSAEHSHLKAQLLECVGRLKHYQKTLVGQCSSFYTFGPKVDVHQVYNYYRQNKSLELFTPDPNNDCGVPSPVITSAGGSNFAPGLKFVLCVTLALFGLSSGGVVFGLRLLEMLLLALYGCTLCQTLPIKSNIK